MFKSKKTQELELKIISLETEKELLEAEIDRAATINNALKEVSQERMTDIRYLTELTHQVDELKSERDLAKRDALNKEEVEKKLRQTTRDIQALNIQKNALEYEIEELKKANKSLSDISVTVDAWKEQISELRDQLSYHKGLAEQHNDVVATLEAQNNALTSMIDKLLLKVGETKMITPQIIEPVVLNSKK